MMEAESGTDPAKAVAGSCSLRQELWYIKLKLWLK